MARRKGLYAYYYGGELIAKGTVEHLSDKLKLSERQLYYLIEMEKPAFPASHLPKIETIERVGEVVQIYNFYKDGRVVATGTKNELAEALNLSPVTIRYYASLSSRERIKHNRVVFKCTEERWEVR
ncbi:hypothetical protein ACFOU0_05985 [Salinicoccus sesuvii]|uniref:HTH merR-type domain-containing protein n=1 Tax=Salinicoccus sesuvii TaxID=868281 RepID=A0ABV7N4B5_9STAP